MAKRSEKVPKPVYGYADFVETYKKGTIILPPYERRLSGMRRVIIADARYYTVIRKPTKRKVRK